MGKKSGMSWLTWVKRAFRSPTKEKENEKMSSRRREDHEQLEEEGKKREKTRWLFSRKVNNNHVHVHVHVQQRAAKTTTINATTPADTNLGEEERHAIAVAGAAEAVAVTAQAAAQIVRLTRPSSFIKEQRAAVVIQTAFRGYLARRALRALKGLVKLQALVRGHNVRNQAKLTLKCMQALVRVQDRVRDQRARLSYEGSRKSLFAESNGLWDSKNLQDIRERKSISRDLNEWDDRPHKIKEIEALVENRKEAAFKRERALAYAFSSQIWRNPSAGSEKELEVKTGWLDRWMATKQCEISNRASTDIKTIEIDTYKPQFCSRRYQYQNHQTPYSVASPLHISQQLPITPSPRTAKPLQVRSASPRLVKEEKHSYSAAHTPSFGSRQWSINNGGETCANTAVPNYMASTESAKARIRSQSAPKHRPSTPERERGGPVKKRLYYPAPEPLGCSQNLRSPSFKSLQCGHFGIQDPSNYYSSCYTESITGGQISPCSTTDLRWLNY